MRSGCPQSQRGASSAFQHWSNLGALPSPQDISVASVPVSHPENGIKNNMVVTQYTWEHRAPSSPHHNFQEPHQRESHTSIASTGFQQPIPGDSAESTWNSRHQISDSSARVSAQRSNYFGTTASENSVNNSGQRREMSKRHFSRRGSNLNNNTGLQQRQELYCTGTSSVALQGESLKVKAKTFTLQDQCSPVSVSKQQSHSPLLTALLTKNTSDLNSFTTPSSSEETNANIELYNNNTHLSDRRHCNGQQIKDSRAALNCGQSRTQNGVIHSGGTPSNPHQQQVSSPCLSSQSSTDQVLPVGETHPDTDFQIQEFVAKKIAYFYAVLNHSANDGHSNKKQETLQSDSLMRNVAHLPTTFASDKDDVDRLNSSVNWAVKEQTTVAVEKALGEDSPKGGKGHAWLTTKSKETGDCAPSASEKHSIGTLISAGEKCAHQNEFLEKSAPVDLDLSVKQHLSVTMPAYGNCKRVYSDDCEDKTFVSSNDDIFHHKWCNKYLQNGMTTLHYSLTALKELIASLENVVTIAEIENLSKVLLQQYWNGNKDNLHLFTFTEYPQIMMEVAATCTKNEDECPVILTAVSEISCDELTEKQPTLSGVTRDLHAKSSSKASENKTFELGSLIENQDANTKKKSVYQQDCGVSCKEVIAPSKLHPSVDTIHNIVSVPTNQTSHEGAREDAGSVCSQTDLSIALSANKIKKHATLSESKGEEALCVKAVKHPQYENISDEDPSQLVTKLPSTEHKKVSFPACSEGPQYEDISSEDEHEVLSFRACSEDPKYEDITSEEESSQIKHMAESSSPTKLPNNQQSPFENEANKHVQSQAQMKTGIISDEELVLKKSEVDLAQHCSCPCLVETADGFVCPKCDSERQTAHSVSCGPSSVLKDEDETDDQTDDEWLFIPISIASLTFEPQDEDQESIEKNVLDGGETGDKERNRRDTSPTHWPSSDLVLETFDTVDSFQEAFKIRNIVTLTSGRSTPEHEMDSEGEPHTEENRRESEDSCETEDSCDYSSASENNHLTVSSKLLTKHKAPLPSETDDSVSEKEGEGVDVTNMQEGQIKSLDKLGNHVQPKANRQTISKKGDFIIVNSDTEDGSDQSCKKKAKRKKKTKRKRQFSSGSEDSSGDPCSKQKRHVPETVDSHCRPVNSPFEEMMLDECSELSHSAEESGIETKAVSCLSETNRQKISNNESVIIINSDTDDDNDQNYKKTCRRRFFSSSGSDSSDAPCVEQNRASPRSVDWEYGTAEEKLQETRLSSAESSLPQHHSKPDAQFKEVKQDARSDLSHSTEISGQLFETKGSSEHVQHKREGTLKRRVVVCDSIKAFRKSHSSKKKAKTKAILSSESDDSSDDRVATKNRSSTDTLDSVRQTAIKKPQKNRQSSEHSPKKQPRSVDKNSTLGANPVIPRLIAKPSQPHKILKLFKETTVHREEKDEAQSQKTYTASSKKADSLEKNKPNYRNMEGRFVHSQKPATKNSVQVSITKSRMASGQDLPRQEGPSTLSSRSGQFSESRQSSASSRDMSQSEETSACTNLSASKQSTSVQRQNVSSKVQRPHSNSNPSALKHPSSKGPLSSATMQPSARTKVGEGWKNAHVPTRQERKTSQQMEEDLRTKPDSWREARQGPSHRDGAPRQRQNSEPAAALMRRQNSHESATPLMKKAKIDAIQWTKAINRDAPTKQRKSVGEGYKWSEGKANKRFQ